MHRVLGSRWRRGMVATGILLASLLPMGARPSGSAPVTPPESPAPLTLDAASLSLFTPSSPAPTGLPAWDVSSGDLPGDADTAVRSAIESALEGDLPHALPPAAIVTDTPSTPDLASQIWALHDCFARQHPTP